LPLEIGLNDKLSALEFTKQPVDLRVSKIGKYLSLGRRNFYGKLRSSGTSISSSSESAIALPFVLASM
jgi:hypothetical protein